MTPHALFAELGLPTPQPDELAPGLWSVLLPATHAADVWQRLHARWPQTGWTPLLIVPDPSEDHYSPADTDPEQARQLSPQQVLLDLNQRISRNIAPGAGPLPPPAEPASLIGTVGELRLLVTHSAEPWLWPALLGHLGAVNLGIDATEVSAVLHQWFDAFGAVPVFLGEAELELWVPNPPTDDRIAWLVATEHGILAPDEVEGRTLVERTAVVRSHRWTFWWD